MTTVLISDIKVEGRFRRDLGDIAGLAASIAAVGLIHPVTVTSSMRLLAGGRRIAAHRLLGLAEIEVHVAETITDAHGELIVERDENTQRKEMLPTEAAALGMALEEMEKPVAVGRMISGKRPSATGGGGSDRSGEVREIAAEAVGLTRGTYTNIKTAITAAANEDEPEEVREVARDVLERIDRGEPIRPNVERIKKVRDQVAPKPEAEAPAEPEQKEEPRRGRVFGPKRKHIDTLNALVNSLDGISHGIDSIEELDASINKEEAGRIMDDLTKQIRSINRIKRLLEGIQ